MTVAITHFAARAGDHTDRAMSGSRLVAAALAARFDATPSVIGVPSPSTGLGWELELEAARGDLIAMQLQYQDVLEAGRSPVTALSRCAVALATLPVIARHRPDAVVVWFDAHADINTPDTSTSGYLGGLALSGPLGLWDSGLGDGLAGSAAILVGARDIDPPEQRLIDAGAVSLIPPSPELAQRLRRAVAGRPVYFHLDCDVLEPGIVPTDYLVPDGLSLETLHAACTVLAESEIVGVEIGELEAEPGHDHQLVAALFDALAPVLSAANRS